MSEIWLAWAALFAGFLGLIWSADRFVGGSAVIAKNLGISKLVIGLTVVSLGTSAPEIVVSISSSLKHAGELAIGNALGSNLANIGLVLAITAFVAPMPIQKHLITQEIPILMLVTLAAGVALYDNNISFWDGVLLAGSLIPLLTWMIHNKKHHPSEHDEETEIPELSTAKAIFWFCIGLLALIISSETLVWGAQSIAVEFGVSPMIIGLTVIAVGTSLPELAASVMSALKGHHDMALGNIIGSNIFNILAVMALPGLIHPPTMDASVFNRDFLAMAAMTALLAGAIVFDYFIRRDRTGTSITHAHLGKRIGCLLLASYIAYYYLLFG
jgi:cation:H+ antiporter